MHQSVSAQRSPGFLRANVGDSLSDGDRRSSYVGDMWQVIGIIVAAGLAGSLLLLAAFLVNLPQRGINYRFDEAPAADESGFLRFLQSLIPLRFSDGNHVRLLLNGEAFDAMLRAVEQARHTITFENYIYWSGGIGRRFAEAFAEKARAGVQVHLVLDWVGSWKLDASSLELMRKAGVEIHLYHRPRFGGMHRLNHRTHRRELVIDGRTAFTGGIGLGDKWLGDGRHAGNWRDNHYLVEGPLVGAVQSAFLDNWLKTSGAVLASELYFPELSSRGDCHAGFLPGSPGERISTGRLMIHSFLKAARHSIRIEQAYFVPDRALRDALVEAVERGVSVEILLPGEHMDYPIVRRASRSLWGPLLQAGVKLYEYQPSMLHVKTLVIDDHWVVTGSANFDFRSLYRNDEVYLIVRDKEFARLHLDVFGSDKEKSHEITWEAWNNRSPAEKLLDNAAALMRTQL
mgnify:CR=1 FL=1